MRSINNNQQPNTGTINPDGDRFISKQTTKHDRLKTAFLRDLEEGDIFQDSLGITSQPTKFVIVGNKGNIKYCKILDGPKQGYHPFSNTDIYPLDGVMSIVWKIVY